MNIKDKIMRLFGYENIENIKIPFEYTKTPPGKAKMKNKREFYELTRKFMELIIITKDWFDDWYLIDGYTSYLIAKENNIKYVKVVRV